MFFSRMAKHPGGRPTKYRRKYCEELIAYFSVEPTKEVTKTITTKHGTVIEEPVQRAIRLPSLERFAANIGVSKQTVITWTENHPEFLDAYKRAKDLQKDILNTNGLLGLYDAGYAKFVAVNCTDMVEKTNHVFPDKDGNPQEIGALGSVEAAARIAYLVGEAMKRKNGNGGAEDK